MIRVRIMKFNRTSINELNALVNRACEVYLGIENDFEEVASKIIWLEVNDFGGIHRFIGLISNEMRNLNNRPELLDNKKEVIFNNNNVISQMRSNSVKFCQIYLALGPKFSQIYSNH